MDNQTFKAQVNEQFARIAKAVANPHRFVILDLLAQGERSVEEIARESHLTVANASQHLQALREGHLVTSRKEGLRVFYRLATPEVFRLLQVIREIAETQLADLRQIVEAYTSSRDLLEPVTMNELAARLHDPALIVLDVRPTEEYQQGHLPGARSIPIDELQARLQELSPAQEIIAYCRGAYCVFADEAVELLKAQGYRVNRLKEGFPDWLLAGLPHEQE